MTIFLEFGLAPWSAWKTVFCRKSKAFVTFLSCTTFSWFKMKYWGRVDMSCVWLRYKLNRMSEEYPIPPIWTLFGLNANSDELCTSFKISWITSSCLLKFSTVMFADVSIMNTTSDRDDEVQAAKKNSLVYDKNIVANTCPKMSNKKQSRHLSYLRILNKRVRKTRQTDRQTDR